MKNEAKSILRSFLLAAIYICWAFIYYKILYHEHSLISIDDAGEKTLKLFLQHIIANIPAILLFAICVKKKQQKKVFLNMPEVRPMKLILILILIFYVLMFFYSLNIIGNIVESAYIAIFYLVFVAFSEEFFYRGILPSILKGNSKWLRLLLPNIIFSISHLAMLFVYEDGLESLLRWQTLYFIISTVIFGIILEMVKRKSGSLYIPVMLHAVYDFYGEISLYIN